MQDLTSAQWGWGRYLTAIGKPDLIQGSAARTLTETARFSVHVCVIRAISRDALRSTTTTKRIGAMASYLAGRLCSRSPPLRDTRWWAHGCFGGSTSTSDPLLTKFSPPKHQCQTLYQYSPTPETTGDSPSTDAGGVARHFLVFRFCPPVMGRQHGGGIPGSGRKPRCP